MPVGKLIVKKPTLTALAAALVCLAVDLYVYLGHQRRIGPGEAALVLASSAIGVFASTRIALGARRRAGAAGHESRGGAIAGAATLLSLGFYALALYLLRH